MAASGPLAMFSWICAKAGRAAIFGLIAGLCIGGAVGFGLGVYFLPSWRAPFLAHQKSFFLPANHTHKMLLKRSDLAP